MNTVIAAFIHHLAFILMFACLFYEHMALKPQIDSAGIRQLIKIDAIYGLCAVVILVAGLLRVFYLEKGPEYYLHNWMFLTKIGLFIAIGLLSIYPTMLFLGWRKTLQQGSPLTPDPTKVKQAIMMIRAELLLFTLILPPAVLMAKGYGYSP